MKQSQKLSADQKAAFAIGIAGAACVVGAVTGYDWRLGLGLFGLTLIASAVITLRSE